MKAEALIQRVREIALALPNATEKLSHGEPAFFVKKKLFAMIDNHHHGSEHVAVWCNAFSGAQESLVDGDPRFFFRPPYVGVKGWVGIRIDRGLDWKVVAELLAQAHAASNSPKKKSVF